MNPQPFHPKAFTAMSLLSYKNTKCHLQSRKIQNAAQNLWNILHWLNKILLKNGGHALQPVARLVQDCFSTMKRSRFSVDNLKVTPFSFSSYHPYGHENLLVPTSIWLCASHDGLFLRFSFAQGPFSYDVRKFYPGNIALDATI